MKTIPKEIYKDLASKLKEATIGQTFFNGTIFTRYRDVDYELKCTLIPDVTPVWYELKIGGNHLDNDFTWDKFKEYLV